MKVVTLSHHVHVALDRDMEEWIVQVNFSASFDWDESLWFLV